MQLRSFIFFFFFFNDPATTEIYTLSLHDALPIWLGLDGELDPRLEAFPVGRHERLGEPFEPLLVVDLKVDRKSTRLNSSHSQISYAVFCLKKKKKKITYNQHTTN